LSGASILRVAHLAHLVAVHWKVSASPKLPSATWVMIRVYCHRAGGYCPEAGGENFCGRQVTKFGARYPDGSWSSSGLRRAAGRHGKHVALLDGALDQPSAWVAAGRWHGMSHRRVARLGVTRLHGRLGLADNSIVPSQCLPPCQPLRGFVTLLAGLSDGVYHGERKA
jgi:hypothetical protein